MKGRVVDIAGTPRHLSLHRGFLVVAEDREEKARIDFDGIVSVVISSPGASLTTNLAAACAERNIPILFCNQRYQPSSIAVPLQSHFDQKPRHESQMKAKDSVKNRLWQKLVKAKIGNQAACLAFADQSSIERLKRLQTMVKPGDPQNIEGQAARIYWPALFGKSFRRETGADGTNSLLNYGYTIIRSTMVKAVFSVGLNPALGIGHVNKKNPFCLVDDLLEPYRPLVDQLVLRLTERGRDTLDPPVKRCLAALVVSDMVSGRILSPLFQNMYDLTYAAWETLDGKKPQFRWPTLLSAIELDTIVSAPLAEA